MKYLTLILALSCVAQAQLWNGLLSNARAGNTWSTAGADPTVEYATRTTCTTLAAGSTAAQINTAIKNCAAAHLADAGGVVVLSAGSYSIGTAGIDFSHNNCGTVSQGCSNVTLRGAGADQTTLTLSNSTTSCPESGGVDICIAPQGTGLGYDGSTDNIASWTAGYSQGTTSITINSFSKGAIGNWSVGSIVFLDQMDVANTPYPTTGLLICNQGNCGQGNVSGRPNRSLTEPQIITSVSGSGPWTIGIKPGIRTPNWFTNASTCANGSGVGSSSPCNPQIWGNSGKAISGVGLENMTLDLSSALSNFSVVQCFGCYNVWIRGIKFIDTHGDTETGANGFYNFWPLQSTNVTYRDNYSQNSPPVSNYYSMSCWTSGDELYENNIDVHKPFNFMAEGCIGSVSAYNFALDMYYTHCHGCGTDTGWQQNSNYRHGGTDMLGLFEGNIGTGVIGDEVFGASDLYTSFRSFYSGRDPNGGAPAGGKTEQTTAVLLYPPNRFWNIIGDVLGTPSYHTTYVCAPPNVSGSCANNNAGNFVADIYSLGYPDGYAGSNDSYTSSSMVKWANFDTVTNAVRYCSPADPSFASAPCSSTSEVATSLSDGFSNVDPYSGLGHTLPNSLFHASQPSWWPASKTWPIIGPDITGGNVVRCTSGTYSGNVVPNSSYCSGGTSASVGAGTVYSNPAMDCYFNTMGGAPNGGFENLTFNADTCYPTGASTYMITVSSIVGHGTITDSQGLINCPGTCTTSAASGSDVLTESPGTGYTFTSWGGGTCSGSATTCTVSGPGPVSVTATFTANPVTPAAVPYLQ